MKKLCSWLSILFILVMIDTKMLYANPIEIAQNEKILTEHVMGVEHMWESTKTYSYENEKLISVLYDEKVFDGSTSKAEVKYIYDESGKIARKDVFQLESTPSNWGKYSGVGSSVPAYHFAPQEEPVVSVLYLYDAKGQLIAEMDAFTSEILVLYFYDERGNLIQKQEDENVYIYFYDCNNNLIQKQEGESVYTYVYDCNNNLTDEEYCNGTQIVRQHYKYDATGRKIAVIDEEGNTTYYSYDDEGNVYNLSNVKIYDGKGRIVFSGLKYGDLFGYTEYTYVD